MKKTILSFATIATISLTMTGCGGTGPTPENANTSKTTKIVKYKGNLKLNDGNAILYAQMKNGNEFIKFSTTKPTNLNKDIEIIKITRYGYYPDYRLNHLTLDCGKKNHLGKEYNKHGDSKFCNSYYTVRSGGDMAISALVTTVNAPFALLGGNAYYVDKKTFDKNTFLTTIKENDLPKYVNQYIALRQYAMEKDENLNTIINQMPHSANEESNFVSYLPQTFKKDDESIRVLKNKIDKEYPILLNNYKQKLSSYKEKVEKERLAKEAKAEKERLAKEAKAEKERLAKEAKVKKERLAKEAKVKKERLTKEISIKKEKYYTVFGKKKEINSTDEFSNKTTIKVGKASFMLEKNLKKLKTRKQKQEEFVKYSVDLISFLGFFKPDDNVDINTILHSQVIDAVINAYIQKGILPSSWVISLPDRKTKGGVVNASINSRGLAMRVFKYLAAKNKLTILNREILFASYLAYKEHIWNLNNDQYEAEQIVNLATIALYNDSKTGDRESTKLTILFANGSDKEISHYLMLIPQVKRNFNYAKKHFGF